VLFPADRSAWHPRSPHVVSARTDGRGAFLLQNLPPGAYRIAAANLDADVWLDAERLGRLAGGSVAVSIGNGPPAPIDLVVH
jgi:hypothetical protein